MSLKKVFIPTSVRPYVRGNVKEDINDIKIKRSEILFHSLKRRKFIVDIAAGRADISETNKEWAKNIMLEIFPRLSGVIKKEEKDVQNK